MADSLATVVVRAVAEAEGLDPMELAPPLGVQVDIEALERYLRNTSVDCRAGFEYHGWRVRLSSDFDVDLEPASGDD